MFYVRHYIILNAYNTELIDILSTRYNISCEDIRQNKTNERYSFTFEVSENHQKFEEIERVLFEHDALICNYDMSERDKQQVFVMYYPVFSDEEYDSAKWLTVRSSFSKIIPENEDEVFEFSCKLGERSDAWCSMHQKVIRPIDVRKFRAWNRKAFASLLYSENELFCTRQTRDSIMTSDFRGLGFSSVYVDKNNNCNDIYQIYNLYDIPDNAFVGDDDMQECRCPICNMKMLAYSNTRGMFRIREKFVDSNVDFYKTPPMFLSAVNQCSGSSRTIISQRLYRYIKQNKMGRALHFVPLETV